MYLPEEWSKLLWVAVAALIGRVLAKRDTVYPGATHMQRLRAKLFDWLWEIPTLLAITLVSYELPAFLGWSDRSAMAMAVVIGYIGLETAKSLVLAFARGKYK